MVYIYRRHTAAKQHCVIVKHVTDGRYNDSHVVTHDKCVDILFFSKKNIVNDVVIHRQFHCAVKAHTLMDAIKHLGECDVIGVDEGQFVCCIILLHVYTSVTV